MKYLEPMALLGFAILAILFALQTSNLRADLFTAQCQIDYLHHCQERMFEVQKMTVGLIERRIGK